MNCENECCLQRVAKTQEALDSEFKSLLIKCSSNFDAECCNRPITVNALGPDKSGSTAGLYKKQLKIKKANHI